MLNTEMGERPGSLFRPWGEKDRHKLGNSHAENEEALNLSTNGNKAPFQQPNSKPLIPTSTETQVKERAHSVFPPFGPHPLHAHWQNLKNLHLHLLTMSRIQHESRTINQVHQNAILSAQIQQAQKMLVQQQSREEFRTPGVAPESRHIHAPASPIYPRPPYVPLRINQDLQSMNNQFPLPSAKDGEPLDLLPKSLYLNKSQGGHLCIFCGKVYSRKYGLKIHLRTHTGYKPLKCKVCSRPFGDPSNLNKHIRLHAEGETPYRCEHCGKVLVRRRDLERHIRSRHPREAVTMGIHDDEDFEMELSPKATPDELDVVG